MANKPEPDSQMKFQDSNTGAMRNADSQGYHDIKKKKVKKGNKNESAKQKIPFNKKDEDREIL